MGSKKSSDFMQLDALASTNSTIQSEEAPMQEIVRRPKTSRNEEKTRRTLGQQCGQCGRGVAVVGGAKWRVRGRLAAISARCEFDVKMMSG